MASLHARGQVVANRVANAATGTGAAVLYTRGATTAAMTVTPFREQPDATAAPSPGTRSADRQREYLIVYDDLVTAGFNAPAEGDRITEVLNSVAVTFEVVRNRTEPAWRWHDEGTRTRVLVHTRPKAVS